MCKEQITMKLFLWWILCRELDVLSRKHICFNLLSCATTLGSLSRLVCFWIKFLHLSVFAGYCLFKYCRTFISCRYSHCQGWLSWMRLENRWFFGLHAWPLLVRLMLDDTRWRSIWEKSLRDLNLDPSCKD